MTFKEKQLEIINLKKKIEKDIQEVQVKEKELTREISFGIGFKDKCYGREGEQRTIEWIKSKEGIFPCIEVWIGDYRGEHTCRITDAEITIVDDYLKGRD